MLPSDYYDGIDIFTGEFNQPEVPTQKTCCCQSTTTHTYDNFTGYNFEPDLGSNPYPF